MLRMKKNKVERQGGCEKKKKKKVLLHAVVPKRLRGWTRNPLGSARAGSNPADCDFTLQIKHKIT